MPTEQMSSEEFRKLFNVSDTPKTKRIDWEHVLQVEFIRRVRSEVVQHYPAARWLHSIPNETGGGEDRQSVVHRAKLIAEGLLSGVFDTFLPVARGGYHGLYIEFKRPETIHPYTRKKVAQGTLSANQVAFQQWCNEEGYDAFVATSVDSAIQHLIDYLTGKICRTEQS